METIEDEEEEGEPTVDKPEEDAKESTEETMSTNKLTEQTESQKEKSRPPKKGRIIDPNEDTDNQISLF